MGMITDLIATRSPHHTTARSRWRHLSDEQKREIVIGFERHRRACLSLEMSPDAQWLVEAIADAVLQEKICTIQ